MENKNPYHIKKISTLNTITVWLVNGERIRKELNENFVQSGHHEHFSFIPTNEFWIDTNTDFREHRFFIDRFFAEQTLRNAGAKPEMVQKVAEKLEQHEREQSLSDEIRTLKDKRKLLLEKIHQKRLETYSSDKLSIWIVDGKMVRDLLFINYDAGGHDRVYPFVPENEIWIEEALSKKERDFILLHELHERFLMGTGKQYPEAHQGATIIEDRFRNHPEGLEERIREEFEKNIKNL